MVKATGYIDTGNTLRDVLTGRYVAVASPAVIYELIPDDYHNILYDYENGIINLDRKSAVFLPEGIHLVPYNTISSSNNLMLAFDCDFFFVNNMLVRKKPLIGMSRNNIQITNDSKCILLNSSFGTKKSRKNNTYNERE